MRRKAPPVALARRSVFDSLLDDRVLSDDDEDINTPSSPSTGTANLPVGTSGHTRSASEAGLDVVVTRTKRLCSLSAEANSALDRLAAVSTISLTMHRHLFHPQTPITDIRELLVPIYGMVMHVSEQLDRQRSAQAAIEYKVPQETAVRSCFHCVTV
jgi:hypothetical protein